MISYFPIILFLVTSNFAQAQRRSDCQIEIIKTINEDFKDSKIKIGKNSKYKVYSETKTGYRTSSLLLGEGLTGSITINNEKINIKCKYLNDSSYELTLSIDGESGGLSTNITIYKNQNTNIGEIVEDLKDKSNEKDITSGYNKSKSKRKNYYNYWAKVR